MRLISSRDAVNFLSQAAPRPWVQRLLRWMAFDEDLPAYSTSGKIQAHGTVIDIVGDLIRNSSQLPGPELDALIREQFDTEIAAKLLGRQLHDRFDDQPVIWNEKDDPIRIDIGFFLYVTDIDWDVGTIISDYIPSDSSTREIFFSASDDLLGSELDRPEYHVVIEGLSFDLSRIEMLLPSMRLGEQAGFSASQREVRSRGGRPPKWDWEAAMAFVVSHAQSPDGLPTGPGAQARIEEMIRDWFLREFDDAPAPSDVRRRAAKIMLMLEMPKTPKTPKTT
jgi:hypothetical protein